MLQLHIADDISTAFVILDGDAHSNLFNSALVGAFMGAGFCIRLLFYGHTHCTGRLEQTSEIHPSRLIINLNYTMQNKTILH